MFHASLLKRAVATQTITVALPAEFTSEEADLVLPQKLLAQHSVRRHGELVNQLLIQWKNKPAEEATWEEELTFTSKFPTFSLEDKTLLDGRGSDRKRQQHVEEKNDQPSWKVYSRRKKGTHGRIKEAPAGDEDSGFLGDKKGWRGRQ